MPTCYAPVRRAPTVLLQPRTRLACVKHAASVRSEPGSNSRLKPVAWAKKTPRFAPRPALPKQIIVARITQSIRARKLGWFRTDSGTSYRLSKSEPPCPAERHIYSPRSMTRAERNVNNRLTFSTEIPLACTRHYLHLNGTDGGPSHCLDTNIHRCSSLAFRTTPWITCDPK